MARPEDSGTVARIPASAAASPEAESERLQWGAQSRHNSARDFHCQLRTHQKKTDTLPKLSHKAPHFQLVRLASVSLPGRSRCRRGSKLRANTLCSVPRGSPSARQESDLAPSV